jgi:hypothetical protein
VNALTRPVPRRIVGAFEGDRIMRSTMIGLAALAVLGAAAGWTPAATAARLDSPGPAAARADGTMDVELEDAFWVCDYAATGAIIDPDERALCAAITEQLRRERFGGDFERMLDWWRANRGLQHRRLDREGAGGG